MDVDTNRLVLITHSDQDHISPTCPYIDDMKGYTILVSPMGYKITSHISVGICFYVEDSYSLF